MPATFAPHVRRLSSIIRSFLPVAGRGRQLPCLPVLALIAAVALATPADAQTGRADLEGRIGDQTGAVVPAANITLTDLESKQTRVTRSAPDGTFVLVDVPAGQYLLAVDSPGFQPFRREIATDGTPERHDVRLDIASLRQNVTVQAAAQASVARTDAALADLPLTINVLPAAYLQTFAVNDLATALQNVPNVNAFTQYGAYEYYSFRGFSDSVQAVDGVRNEGNRVRTQLSNVERVEVLKGPASVLYGADAVGATVNIVLKKPSAAPLYDGSFAFGNWNTTRAAFGAGGRLHGPRLLYRIDAGFDHSDGYRHDGSTRLNITPAVSWRLSDRDLVEVRYAGNRNDLAGDAGIPLQTLADGTAVIPGVPRDRRYNTPADFALSSDHNVRAGYTRLLSDALTLRATFGGRRYDDEYWVAESLSVDESNQVEREFLYFKHVRRPYFGQVEVTGRVRAGIDHDLLAGWEAQFYRTRTTRSNDASRTTTPIDLWNPVETHATWTSFPVSRFDYTRSRSQALYLQDTAHLGTTLKVVGGVRFDHLARRTNNNPVSGGIETVVDPVERRSRAWTYRVGTVFQPHSSVDLFAQYATAFRPNYNLQPDGSTIAPETGRQVEAGQRLRLAAGAIDLTTSVFHIEKRNIALARPGGAFDLAGIIRSRGIEHDVTWRPTSLASINVAYGFTDAAYVDYVTASADFSGNERPRTPRHSLSASASFVFRNGVSLGLNAQSRGRQFLNDGNTVALDGYGIVNVSAGYTRGIAQYMVAFSNLTGTDYWASALGNTQLYPGEPLRVMATIRLRSR
jgi:iron complex outermembrane receptor protein